MSTPRAKPFKFELGQRVSSLFVSGKIIERERYSGADKWADPKENVYRLELDEPHTYEWFAEIELEDEDEAKDRKASRKRTPGVGKTGSRRRSIELTPGIFKRKASHSG